jgi:hypothetical protein
MTGIELLEALDQVNIPQIAEDAINETSQQAADILATQMATGINSIGQRLPDYSAFTVDFKQQYGVGLGKVSDRRTLYMTGEHYSELYVRAQGEEIEFGSHDPKSEFIQKREGNEIYGFNADSRETYAPITFEKFKEKFTEQTGLNFNE